jgi:branched-chain amino acid transport system substrate-binding protein
MSDIKKENTELQHNSAAASRRALLKGTGLAVAGAGLYGVAPFMGPWKHNHAWAQTAQKKR